jgi:hypothetical protein
MNSSASMCGFRDYTQGLDNACCAFSASENVEQVAKGSGINAKLLRNKLNPSQPHRLTVGDLISITQWSGNYCIVNSLLLNLDMVAVHVDRTATDQTLVKRTLENSKNAGELARLTLENGGETRLPRSKRNELLARAHRSVNNLVLLMSDLENKTSGVTPFLSMGIDFIANGAPIPGLS